MDLLKLSKISKDSNSLLKKRKQTKKYLMDSTNIRQTYPCLRVCMIDVICITNG